MPQMHLPNLWLLLVYFLFCLSPIFQTTINGDGEKENRGPNVDVGIEGNSGSDGKSEWSEIVQACVKEGWWACFEKSIGVWSKGKEEARMTEEDMENASG